MITINQLGRALDEALAAPEERERRADLALRTISADLGIDAWLSRVWALYDRVLAAPRNR